MDTLWKVNGTTAITCRKKKHLGPHTFSFSVLFVRVMLCVMLCCVVWECMWCLWCCLWFGVVGGRGVCLVCVWCVCRVLACPREVYQRNRWILPIFKFENRSNTARSQPLQSFALPDENCSTPASKPGVKERYARQCRYEPPLEIFLTLPFSHCVHNLSGPDTHALTQTTFKTTENTHTCFHESSRTQPH